jgi:hypothetical protein
MVRKNTFLCFTCNSKINSTKILTNNVDFNIPVYNSFKYQSRDRSSRGCKPRQGRTVVSLSKECSTYCSVLFNSRNGIESVFVSL